MKIVKKHEIIHLLVFGAFVLLAVILSQVPNKHAWDRYIDSKKKNHEIEPLDKKGEDIYYASLSFAILSALTGALWIYMHGKGVKNVLVSYYEKKKTPNFSQFSVNNIDVNSDEYPL